MNCRPGDLAVVVEAYNPSNIGSIVRVLRSHPNQKVLVTEPGDHIWTMEATHPQAYEVDGALVYRSSGPVPDSYLRPIRGYPLGRDIADGVPAAIAEFEASQAAAERAIHKANLAAKAARQSRRGKTIRRRSVKSTA
ncbi:MAG: hypothetical protein ACKO69_00530 [Limnohabitans sp.]